MKTLFIVCQHGDEQAPLEVLQQHFQGVEYLLANPAAYQKSTRYIETDLNRSFPGSPSGSQEEKIAFKLVKILKGFKPIIDLHTASCETPIFIILTKISQAHLDLANQLGVKRLVFMQNSPASGRSLIDHVELGLSVEIGAEKNPVTKRRTKVLMKNYLNNSKKSSQLEYYSVFGKYEPQSPNEKLVEGITPFKRVKKGQLLSQSGESVRSAAESFYPLLPRSKNYKGALCLMAKKVSEKEFKMLEYKL